MKRAIAVVILAITTLAHGAEVAIEQPVLLPAVVVTAPPGSVIFTLSFESALPLPFSKVTRAAFKKIFPGPVKDGGIEDGDQVLRIDGVEVRTMTVLDMWRKIKRQRINGTREEFVIRTKKGEERAVVIAYEERKKPNSAGAALQQPPHDSP